MAMRLRSHLKNQRENDVTQTPLPAMSAGAKRILINRSISDTHKAMCGSGALKLRRAFIATGTWLPVAHLQGTQLVEPPPEDSQVKVQHFHDYVYSERVNRQTIEVRRKEIVGEERERLAIEKRRQSHRRLSGWAKELSYSSWIKKGSQLLPLVR